MWAILEVIYLEATRKEEIMSRSLLGYIKVELEANSYELGVVKGSGRLLLSRNVREGQLSMVRG